MNRELRKKYIRTDRYGTKIYDAEQSCKRCGGAGGYQGWPGFTCYRCNGIGIDPKLVEYKEYTPERRAQLDKQAEVRAQKKRQQYLDSIPQLNEEFKKKHLLTRQFIHCLTGNTYAIKDELKAEGCLYKKEFGWYTDSTDRDCVAIMVKDITEFDADGRMSWKPQEVLDKFAEKIIDATTKGKYFGEIGERYTTKVTIKNLTEYESKYGNSKVYTLNTPEGYVLTYFGTVNLGEIGDTIEIKGTVKEHKVYCQEKQTVINRPTVKKGE